jgi:hypothetical protein
MDPPLDGEASGDEDATLEETRREERKKRQFNESRTERLHYPNDIPPTSFTRAYEQEKPIDRFRPENSRPNFDASATMPLAGAAMSAVVESKLAGRLSLLEALKFKDWQAVEAHTGAAACQVADAHGRLPLLLALTGGAPVDVSLGLLEAYPDAVKKPDPYGNLPLHIAIVLQLEIALVLALHDAYPKASWATNEFDDLALHLVLKQTKPVETPGPELVEQAAPEPEPSQWWQTATSFVSALGAEKRGDAHAQESGGGGGGAAQITTFSQLLSAVQPASGDDAADDAAADDGTDDPLGAWKLQVTRALLRSNAEAVVETCGNGAKKPFLRGNLYQE